MKLSDEKAVMGGSYQPEKFSDEKAVMGGNYTAWRPTATEIIANVISRRFSILMAASPRWDTKGRLVDLSQYNENINVAEMIEHGKICGIVARAGDGYIIRPEETGKYARHIDRKYMDFLTAAETNDIPFGAYWFYRLDPDIVQSPTKDSDEQFQSLSLAVNGRRVHFICLDIEEPAGETNTNIKKKVETFANWCWETWPDKMVIFYTSMGFLNSYSIALREWLGSGTAPKHLWMAQWIWYGDKETTTWDDIYTNHLPSETQPIYTPGLAPRWELWQWAVKFVGMEGAGSNEIDLDWYNGTKEQFYEFVDFKPGTTPPPPEHECPTGQHWDETLQQCVADEPEPPPTDLTEVIALLNELKTGQADLKASDQVILDRINQIFK